MKRALRVLSIDFDYFQIVDEDTISCYPDGIDLGTDFSRTIWAGHYANPEEGDKILKVEVDTDKIDRIKRILSDIYDISVRSMICNSHRHIYDFIKDIYEESDDFDGVDIYNVDMHHDMINDNPNIDCGNWVSHIMQEIPNSTITWIANPISKNAYGLDKDRFSMVSEDLSDLEYIDFDVVFLCRSDMWTPPHLDSYFTDLSYYIIDDLGFENIMVEDGILDIRNCTKEINDFKRFLSKEIN